jgi:5-carboxymethyl-2-hydroxymuconate isomerase
MAGRTTHLKPVSVSSHRTPAFAAIFASRAVGITLQIDEGAPVFDAKHSSLHPLFEGR